jgi:hypothetical protein
MDNMIVKEKTTRPNANRMERIGDAAEQQMAFYLRRRFGEHSEVRVFNDLRIERQGEFAQIDHLILHKHGLIIIESKSVTGEVHVNAQLEFVRVFGKKRTGMPSPIQQAHRQGALLRQLLIDNKESLRHRKILGLVQGGFRACPIQVLVAISDQGIIKRPRQDVPELHKADQIPEQAHAIIERHKKAYRITSPHNEVWGRYLFHPEEVVRITGFLLDHHVPLVVAKPEVAQIEQPPVCQEQSSRSLPMYLCMKCHSTNLEVRFGHSYYFKCLDCDGNTPIKNACRSCGAMTKTRKRGTEFSAVCSACGCSEVFFINSDSIKTP